MDVRPLRANELDEADRIFRLAFGTFLGLPDPVRMFSDTQLMRTRFATDPDSFYQSDNREAFNRPDVFVVDDWR